MTGPTQLIGTSADSSNLLNRGTPSSASTALTPAQAEVDQLVTDFSKHATEWKSLAAMMAGGMAYQTGRLGVISTGVRGSQALSVAVGLGTEVTAFEMTNRSLASLTGEGTSNPNLWKWSGRGGLQQGLLTSLISFGSLKGFGKLAEGQNLILQHGAQDAGMVLGHQLVYQAGIGPKPEGTFAQQFLNAEVTNLQLGAGMALGRGLAPFQTPMGMVPRIEEKVEKNTGVFPFPFGKPALAGVGLLPAGEDPARELSAPISMMSNMGPGGPGGSGGGRKSGRTSASEVEPLEELTPDDLEEVPEGPEKSPSSIIVHRDARDGTRYRSSINIDDSSPPAPPAVDDPYVGQTIDGRYLIEKVLGMGGMGTVYACTHETLDKRVAMKVLQKEFLQGNPKRVEEIADRFLLEAKAAAAASRHNDHIIDISDFGRLPDGSPYFVMEFLEGTPLIELTEGQKPVPVPRILHIAHQLAEGLGAAHQAGVIHRDLKPDNIFLIKRGKEKDFVKILDFGIAKVTSNGDKRLTKAGHVMGTPEYMSPEQAFGGEIDQRSDIYSLGIILYQMATGKTPFDDPSDVQKILTAQMYKPPTPIHELDPLPQSVPPGLEAIIMKCLSKHPDQRYQSMDEVLAELDKLDAGQVPKAVPEMMAREASEAARRKISNRWPILVGVGGAGAVGLLAAALISRSSNSTMASSPSVQPPNVLPPPNLNNNTPPSVVPLEDTNKKKVKDVALVVEPTDAHVFQIQDGQEKDLGTNPMISVEEGSSVEIEIRKEGYKTKKIVLDGAKREALVQLDRESKGPRPKYPRPIPSGSAQPKPRPKNESDGVVNPWKDPAPK